nr:MAG TPA: hypothetical protein [Bacteriophage sp.]
MLTDRNCGSVTKIECKELFLCHDKNINSEREDVPFFSGRKDLSS